jgi:hypothetical protein
MFQPKVVSLTENNNVFCTKILYYPQFKKMDDDRCIYIYLRFI